MTATHHPHRLARLTGTAYLGIIVTGLFAEFFVRMGLVAPGDAATTAAQIAAAPDLFRAGLMSDVFMIGLDVAVAIGLYALLRDISRPWALLATAFRLIQAAILGANLMNMASALQFATSPGGAHDAFVLHAMSLHRTTYDLGLVFFGLSCLALGPLLRRSRLVPPVAAWGLAVAGAIYLVGSTLVVLAPGWAASFDPMYAVTLVAELSVAGWLTVRGAARAARASSSAPAPAWVTA